MAIDLVPNNHDFRVEDWHYLTEEENEKIFIVDTAPDGEPVLYKRSELRFPPNVFTLTDKQWKPFWTWVCQNRSEKEVIFTKKELIAGHNSAGLFVSSLQCTLLALELSAAILTGSSIPARATRTVAFLYEGDEKVPVVGWTRSHEEGPNEFPVIKRDGKDVIVVEVDPETKEPKTPTVLYEETVPETVTTLEDGTQIVGDAEGGDWYYWTLPHDIAVALLEFIKKSNGFTIL
jgi:hypothetical protein